MDALMTALQKPALYDHPVDSFRLIETHISRVLLTGSYAYKFKKPVNFGFLNFSTLEKRKYYCEEELRLNKRLAASLYLDIVTITGTQEHPQINGDGPALEYAVRMKEFPQQAQLDRLLAQGKLLPEHIDAIASVVARFHQQTTVADHNSVFGSANAIQQPVHENFCQIQQLLESEDDRTKLNTLKTWSDNEFAKLTDDFASRKDNGFVRECHGDMHLRNIALVNSEVLIFDCIEFSDELRWVDVISEIAFLVMDLHARDQSELAARFINRYLELTGDYAGLKVLRYYLVYRAMVRAKVDMIRAQQPDLPANEKEQVLNEFRHYLDLALQYTTPKAQYLLITHGLSGSGKTFFTQQLLEMENAIRIRSDIERKRIFSSVTDNNTNIYSSVATEQTYQTLLDIAAAVLQAHWPVFVDATFIDKKHRDMFQALALELRLPFIILEFSASEEILRERITARIARHDDASDATLEVLNSQLSHWQDLSASENRFALAADSSNPAQFRAGLRHMLDKPPDLSTTHV